MPLERDFQPKLIKEIQRRLPGCIILKGDANKKQGVPDLLILHNDKWGALEVKRESRSTRRPNQPYYIEKMNNMSYASFIDPETRELKLDELQQALGA